MFTVHSYSFIRYPDPYRPGGFKAESRVRLQTALQAAFKTPKTTSYIIAHLRGDKGFLP